MLNAENVEGWAQPCHLLECRGTEVGMAYEAHQLPSGFRDNIKYFCPSSFKTLRSVKVSILIEEDALDWTTRDEHLRIVQGTTIDAEVGENGKWQTIEM